MAWNKIAVGCKVIALLMLLTVIMNWRVVNLWHIQSLPIGWYLLIILNTLLFFVTNTMAAVGLFWVKKWGFGLSYFAIVFSTLFFSTAYIPFVSHFFPKKNHALAVMVINLIVILIIGSLQYLSRRKSRF
ncbi:MAG: hypothetical protein P4M14_08560 [Gammaproteobacteria bacterium]|nr:hypothetical protein [Gammaproteobacteria bacterium]